MAPADDVRLTVRNLACRRAGRHLFGHISVQVPAGTALCVKGENGSGKSTLLEMLAGVMRPQVGTIAWCGQPILADRPSFVSNVVYIGHKNALDSDLQAWENLFLWAKLQGLPASKASVREVLEHEGLCDIAERPVGSLSQGQARRIALARLRLGRQRRLWLLDEPFSALDEQATVRLRRLLRQHLDGGGILVFSNHEHGASRDIPCASLDLGSAQRC